MSDTQTPAAEPVAAAGADVAPVADRPVGQVTKEQVQSFLEKRNLDPDGATARAMADVVDVAPEGQADSDSVDIHAIADEMLRAEGQGQGEAQEAGPEEEAEFPEEFMAYLGEGQGQADASDEDALIQAIAEAKNPTVKKVLRQQLAALMAGPAQAPQAQGQLAPEPAPLAPKAEANVAQGQGPEAKATVPDVATVEKDVFRKILLSSKSLFGDVSRGSYEELISAAAEGKPLFYEEKPNTEENRAHNERVREANNAIRATVASARREAAAEAKAQVQAQELAELKAWRQAEEARKVAEARAAKEIEERNVRIADTITMLAQKAKREDLLTKENFDRVAQIYARLDREVDPSVKVDRLAAMAVAEAIRSGVGKAAPQANPQNQKKLDNAVAQATTGQSGLGQQSVTRRPSPQTIAPTGRANPAPVTAGVSNRLTGKEFDPTSDAGRSNLARAYTNKAERIGAGK